MFFFRIIRSKDIEADATRVYFFLTNISKKQRSQIYSREGQFAAYKFRKRAT